MKDVTAKNLPEKKFQSSNQAKWTPACQKKQEPSAKFPLIWQIKLSVTPLRQMLTSRLILKFRSWIAQQMERDPIFSEISQAGEKDGSWQEDSGTSERD